MKAFEFSLQKLLEARQAREQAAEEAFGKAMRKLDSAEKERVRLHGELRRCADAMAGLTGGRMVPSELLQWAECLEAMRVRLEWQAERVDEEKRLVELRREAFVEAMRDRKVMEQLRARELKRWLLETRRKERREMDEIAGVAFVRQRREGARV